MKTLITIIGILILFAIVTAVVVLGVVVSIFFLKYVALPIAVLLIALGALYTVGCFIKGIL